MDQYGECSLLVEARSTSVGVEVFEPLLLAMMNSLQTKASIKAEIERTKAWWWNG